MITEISNNIADFFCVKIMIEEDLRVVYQVGFDVMISTSIQVAAIAGAGWLLGDLAGAFLFLLCFMTIRAYSGGYHAKTRTRCLAVMVASYCFTVWAGRAAADCPDRIILTILAAASAFDFVVFFFCVPVKNNTKVLKENWKCDYRKKAFAVLIFWQIAGFVLMGVSRELSARLLMSQLVTVLLVLLCKNKLYYKLK